MTEWYDDEALWEDLAPVLFSEEHWTKAGAEVDAVGFTNISTYGSLQAAPDDSGREVCGLAWGGQEPKGSDPQASANFPRTSPGDMIRPRRGTGE